MPPCGSHPDSTARLDRAERRQTRPAVWATEWTAILAASERSSDTPPPPWADDVEYETLYLDLPGNAGPVSEVAFLTVDAVVFIPENRPPLVFETYFDKATVEDPKFWPRTVLQSVFLPLREQEGSDGRRRSYPGFDAIQQRLIRAPILRGFRDARAPLETRQWISKVATKWPFNRVVTSHFASPIVATGRDVMGAFSYLLETKRTTRADCLPSRVGTGSSWTG
jgi:Domain of unknown function (DUF4336)